ncbi:MAG: glycoside hydrolase family 3 N-terminal domain-containing protein [Propionicimonas sp.]|jgi:beta-N-acetylhexosaminidase|uniref:beta-N-acetylhexosaminidase n=1 Tax=Brooklawnia propionicigenes TaxID=3041175 RepID=A0AAN0MGW9_9ACTN|nr:glycoside hydrolase family 3 N-terminal domain-containing protein [Brooklawnia sp. SH051]MEA5053404.1 glycoside hydrolase family 3 N-terminal domain-containing protein [Propionicimonas sp.]BEH02307.1 glycoside hydrolase family 3 N-terminal domain-containing protein [Brooklawnia sp. SH051]
MPALVDLTAAPYQLDPDQISWVEETLESMTLDEQVGQLFTNLFFFGADSFSGNSLTAEEIIEKYHIGIARYHGGTAAQVQDLLNRLQSAARIPLLIAANCDSGGNGAMNDGTYVASGAQTEASGSTAVAHDAGYVSGREMRAIGANLNFDPCVDILFNWRNTIVNTRAYGTNAADVIKYTIPFVEGQRESGILSCIKHWPGDGTEERDQHLVLGVNELRPEEWEASFGEVYRAHIANGVEMIMAGHIALPHYQKELNPALTDADILPATLAPELINGLLKDRLGFNGAVITDASHMLGMTSAMRREDYVPAAIAAGCDAFLFFNDLAEDFGFMKAGVEKGVISKERLDDANRRILGLKAKLNLHRAAAQGTLLRTPEDLAVVGCAEHLAMRANAADLGITLVKNTLDQLPLNPRDHRRIRIYHLTGEVGGITGGGEAEMLNTYIAALTERGYEVTVNDGTTRVKGPTLRYREEVDAALILAEVIGYGAQNNYRIQWKTAMSNECPWYVWEVPTFMVSHNFTTHLHDATMVKCYVNAYHPNEANVRATLDKLEGRSEFKGTPNELVWTQKWQAKL